MPSASPATADAPVKDLGVLKWLVAATFIVVLNETIMVNAIPALTSAFGVTEVTAQWLSTAFMLTMATVIPVTGWFLQRVTTRTAFVVAMGVFAVGTLLAALAPTFVVLLLARIIQAAGTAVMMPLLMTTLMTVVPESDRGRVMGNVSLAISVAPALGPTISGLLLDLGSWRYIFVAVLPVALLIGYVGLRGLTNVGESTAGPIDVLSVPLSGIGFGTLVYGLSRLSGEGSGLPAWPTIAVGVLGIALFVWRQLALQRVGSPLLDLRTLTKRTFTLGVALMCVAFMGMMGSMIMLTLYLQSARGLSALESGLVVMPGGVVMGLLGPQVGKLFDRVGARPLLVPGTVVITGALAVFTQFGLTTPLWMIVATHLVLMVALSAVFTPVFTLSLGALPMHLYAHGSSLLGALQQVAAAMGTAVTVTVASAHARTLAESGSGAMESLVGGMQWAFGVGAVLGGVAVVISLLMPNRPDNHRAPGHGESAPEAGDDLVTVG